MILKDLWKYAQAWLYSLHFVSGKISKKCKICFEMIVRVIIKYKNPFNTTMGCVNGI